MFIPDELLSKAKITYEKDLKRNVLIKIATFSGPLTVKEEIPINFIEAQNENIKEQLNRITAEKIIVDELISIVSTAKEVSNDYIK